MLDNKEMRLLKKLEMVLNIRKSLWEQVKAKASPDDKNLFLAWESEDRDLDKYLKSAILKISYDLCYAPYSEKQAPWEKNDLSKA